MIGNLTRTSSLMIVKFSVLMSMISNVCELSIFIFLLVVCAIMGMTFESLTFCLLEFFVSFGIAIPGLDLRPLHALVINFDSCFMGVCEV